jgi:hypothetical protein
MPTWLCARQFYTFVNKEPSRLHCFYTKKSTFIHGTEGEECPPRYGQQVCRDFPRSYRPLTRGAPAT